MKKKLLSLLLMSVVIPTMVVTSVTANSNIVQAVYPQGVTSEMTNPLYWKNLAEDVDSVLMTKNEIKELNQAIIDEAGTKVVDLTKIEASKTQDEMVAILSNIDIPVWDLYINGEKIDNTEYFGRIKDAIKNTGYKGSEKVQYYAVAALRADIKALPTNDVIVYSEDNPNDCTMSSILNVNEPFVFSAKCTLDGNTFYWGYSSTCSGWVDACKLAVFDSKDDWIDAWKVDECSSDFLVVTQDKIVLEPSIQAPETSELQLMLGTVLKLVPEDEIPENIAERGTWFNYVVYLPTRDENGKYVRQIGLISLHYSVSIGFLPMTQSNILDVAFSCLGNRYGWGGMLGSMDCSLYNRCIYKCFGLELPRNTTWQENTPGKVTNISGLSDEEKQAYLETLSIGSLLYFPGHTMMYIGSKDNVAYVINDVGSLSDSYGDLDVRNMYSVIINPLTVRRADGRTWLNHLNAALSFS